MHRLDFEAGCLGSRKGAGLPLEEELFQAAEDEGEAGHDEGAQGLGHDAVGQVRFGSGAEAGEVGAQRW